MRRRLRQAGVVDPLTLAVLGLAALTVLVAPAVGANNDKAAVKQAVGLMRSQVDGMRDRADELERTRPAQADLLRARADELELATKKLDNAEDDILVERRGSLGNKGGFWSGIAFVFQLPLAPAASIARELGEHGTRDLPSGPEYEFLATLEQPATGEWALWEDIVRIRVRETYLALGGRYLDGIAQDQDTMAIAQQQVKHLYEEHPDPATRRTAFIEALHAVIEGKDPAPPSPTQSSSTITCTKGFTGVLPKDRWELVGKPKVSDNVEGGHTGVCEYEQVDGNFLSTYTVSATVYWHESDPGACEDEPDRQELDGGTIHSTDRAAVVTYSRGGDGRSGDGIRTSAKDMLSQVESRAISCAG